MKQQGPSTIEVVNPPSHDVWQDFVDRDPLAVAYQSPDWFRSICSATRAENVSRLYSMADGRRLLLPLTRTRYTPGPLRVAGSPPKAWGMGGLLAPDGITDADVGAIMEDLRSLGYLRLSIRPNPLLGDTWSRGVDATVHRSPRLAHVVDLRPGWDHLWKKGFDRAVRKGVAKAERSGVEIECDSTDRLLPVYYQLFEDSVKRWSEQQREPLRLAQFRARRRDPYSKLKAIVDGMGAKCRIWIATVKGEPASALITIQDGRSINGVKAAMNKDLAGPLHTNDLIYSRLVEEACANGYDFYHLGESGGNPRLDAFKRRFGAEGHSYSEYYLERIPLSRAEALLRSSVKRAIGFRDF